MKQKNKGTRVVSRRKGTLQKSFLVISLVFSVLLMTQCRKIGDFWPPKHFPHHHKPTSEITTSLFTDLFVATSKTAGGEIGGAAAGWAVSALGLTAASPDYTQQLNKIDDDLKLISSQLSDIQTQLNAIAGELGVINCTNWASTLKDEKARIYNLMQNYGTMVATAATGGIVSQDALSDWVDQVLAEGSYTAQTPMGQILASIATQVYLPPASGIIPACIQTIPAPADYSFGTDTAYYNQVKLYTDYYAAYQVWGLTLLNEALHYRAWVADGSPDSDSLSADSTSYVCANPNVVLFCNQASASVSTMYNNLIIQLTAGGAPYTSGSVVMNYAAGNPYLWPHSLEDFTTAAGNNCNYPLTSDSPCGITADWYKGNNSMANVIYKGYSGWQAANTSQLINLFEGWSSSGGGLAGDYLEDSLGFKNMVNKIIFSSEEVQVSLNESGSNQFFVPFFDTQWSYYTMPSGGAPARREDDFQQGTLNKIRHLGDLCGNGGRYIDVDYDTRAGLSYNPNGFYNAYSHARYCSANGIYYTPFNFQTWPGYLAEQNGSLNRNSNARQFHMPVTPVAAIKCTGNRLPKNAGGVWTLCGDDFTAWISNQVPRPETCDIPANTGVTCTQL